MCIVSWGMTDPNEEYTCVTCGEEIYTEYYHSPAPYGGTECVYCYLEYERRHVFDKSKKTWYSIVEYTLETKGRISR